MKRIISFLFIGLSPFSAFAQNEEKTVTLDEVAVKGAKVVNKVDGKIIFPTDAQKKSSANGYSILQKLSLPRIRVDEVAHSVTAIGNMGGVQIRINGIVVGKQEMLALEPNLIAKIDFIDNPGVRYGDGIAFVINFITKKSDSGYTLGTDLTSTLTSLQGDGMVYGKRNFGKSEFTVSYGVNGYRLNGVKSTQVADYTLNDGSVYTIERNDIESLYMAFGHNMKLTYNLADTTAYVFQVSLSETLGRTPESYSVKEILDGTDKSMTTSRYSGRNNSPVLDIYFFRQITPRQSITANAVGTYISTRQSCYNDEVTLYQYDVNGKSASAWSEIVYENRLKPFNLSAGLNYRYKYTKNNYTGDALALTETNQDDVYMFSEIKGSLKKLRYSLGLGASYVNYEQNGHKYDYWTFRPKATVMYDFIQGMQLRYTYSQRNRDSRIAMTSDATIRTNSMEYTVGNPDLKPTRDTEHAMNLSYNNSRWSTFTDVFYRHCHRPNMALYERTEDDKFIYTQINQKEIDLLCLTAYAGYWIMPEKLQVAASGGMQRCFNFGNSYSHFYTSWFYTGYITAYLGKFTLQAYADNGYRWLEGETKGHNCSNVVLKASYRHKDWQFSLSWSNPFAGNYMAWEGELINRYIHKLTKNYNRENGNRLSLNISWRMSKGKKYLSAEKTINLKDTDNGIMK